MPAKEPSTKASVHIAGYASPRLANMVRADARQNKRSVSWVVVEALKARYGVADEEQEQ